MPSSVQDTPVCCVQVTRLSLQNDCYTTTLRDGEFMRFRSRLSTGMTDYLFPPTILSNPSHGACQAHSTTMFLQHRAVAPRLGRAQPLLFNGSQHQSEQTLVVSTLPQGPMREESEEKRPAAIRSEDRARTGLGWTPPPAPRHARCDLTTLSVLCCCKTPKGVTPPSSESHRGGGGATATSVPSALVESYRVIYRHPTSPLLSV